MKETCLPADLRMQGIQQWVLASQYWPLCVLEGATPTAWIESPRGVQGVAGDGVLTTCHDHASTDNAIRRMTAMFDEGERRKAEGRR